MPNVAIRNEANTGYIFPLSIDDLSVDASGYLRTAEQYAPAYENNTDAVAHVNPPFATAWAENHEPAANTIATCTKTAPGAGKRLVVRSISAFIAWGNVTPTPAAVFVRLIEDAAGTPVTRWSGQLAVNATAGQVVGFARDGLNIKTTAANKTLTLAFSAAGGANTQETVSMSGDVITEA